MAVGSELPSLGGYPFEVRYSDGGLLRGRSAADVAADAYVYFWDCFHSTDRVNASEATAASLAPLLSTEVSPILGRAVRDWR